MKTMKRALRRHHRQRMMARARRILATGIGPTDPEFEDRVRRSYDNLSVCSCWMCGNPRKWRGLPTVQERRWSQRGADLPDDAPPLPRPCS